MNQTERAIIFCDRISQAENIYNTALHALHLKVGHYHSEMTPEMRKIQLEAFRNGEIRILVTCKALDEGLNVPDAAVGIVVSSSKNERQRIQRLGRILRKNKDKRAVMYYLHTSLPIDRPQYLSELAEDTETADMEYLPAEHDFYCDAYVARAEHILNQNAFSKSEYNEFIRCINEGNGKADWLLSEELYQKYIQNSETRKEKNYWTIMRRLSLADMSSED
jgi:superfamily II DNA or RNA helicase